MASSFFNLRVKKNLRDRVVMKRKSKRQVPSR